MDGYSRMADRRDLEVHGCSRAKRPFSNGHGPL